MNGLGFGPVGQVGEVVVAKVMNGGGVTGRSGFCVFWSGGAEVFVGFVWKLEQFFAVDGNFRGRHDAETDRFS